MKLSVLMAMHYNDNPDFFVKAMESLFKQTRLPEEVILVQDGPLSDELSVVVKEVLKKYGDLLKVISLPRNVGLAVALNYGLKYCSYDLVARMDSDDISRRDRFEKQINFLIKNSNIDVLGSYIQEYDVEMRVRQGIRNVPLEYKDIVRYAKWRNPMNHMSVVFRKKAVSASGGYKIKYFEDYCLWAQMIKNGYKFANIPEILIFARTGADFITRRRGFKYFKFERDMLRYLKKIKFINQLEFLLSYMIRSISRILPVNLLSFFYKFLRQKI